MAMPEAETLTATPERRFAPEADDPLRDNGHVTSTSHCYRGEVGGMVDRTARGGGAAALVIGWHLHRSGSDKQSPRQNHPDTTCDNICDLAMDADMCGILDENPGHTAVVRQLSALPDSAGPRVAGMRAGAVLAPN